MRIAVVSDVHSNLEALEAVLRHAGASAAVDEVWCLGDIVGYGPDPSGVIAVLRDVPLVAVAGNHDLAACGKIEADEFNAMAAAAVEWTARRLSDEDRAFLEALPMTTVERDFTLVHGSLREPEWEYLLTQEQAAAQFGLQQTQYSLVGHSHLQFRADETANGPVFYRGEDAASVQLSDTRMILNPGSSGQPRDGDPRAGYVLYDEQARTTTYHRVEYDIAAVQRKMHAAGLPPWLAERLSLGK